MEQTLDFANTVIIIDAGHLDMVVGEISTRLAADLGRDIPKLDVALFLETLLLDAGLEAEEERSSNVLWIHSSECGGMKNVLPSDFDKDFTDTAFRGPMGEFTFNSFQPEGVVDYRELFMESLTLAAESDRVKRLIVVGDEMNLMERMRKAVEKRKAEVMFFGLVPSRDEKMLSHSTMAYALLRAMGLEADDLKK